MESGERERKVLQFQPFRSARDPASQHSKFNGTSFKERSVNLSKIAKSSGMEGQNYVLTEFEEFQSI